MINNIYDNIVNSNKVFVIAEAGVNHNQDMRIAKKLVDIASDAKADAIKFQTFKAEEIVGEFSTSPEYQKQDMSQFEMLKKLEFSFEQFIEIKRYCDYKNILFLSTPDGVDSLNFLTDCKVPLIKIGSTEITNLPFLKQIAKTGIPIILSTGMSNLGEVEKAVNTLKNAQNTNIILMHCVTDYPANIEDVNLRAIKTMQKAFNLPVGYSDHTKGFEAAIAAVALGASVIEKHFTIDTNLEGPDHKASLNPEELNNFITYIRNTEKLLGTGEKKPTLKELKNIPLIRRSIVAAEALKEGTVLTNDIICFKRPGYGISPEFLDVVLGKKLKRALLKDEPIRWEDI